MIAAIVLAAGESKRMGKPKMLLAWRETTVLGQVLHILKSAGIREIVVVTGSGRDAVESICREARVGSVFNAGYAEGEMIASLQAGLRALDRQAEAAIVALGDQPQIEEKSVRRVVQRYQETRAPLIVASFQKRRGHPWLVDRARWDEILAMSAPETGRDFINRHATDIEYVEVDSDSVLRDLDTPEEYLKMRP